MKPLSGFTLIELLVVMAILTASAMLVAPALGRFFQPKAALPPGDMLMKGIARARDNAILQQRSFRGFLDLGENRFESADGEVLVQLPRIVHLEATDDARATLLPCRFGPDGRGCAMMLRLKTENTSLLLAVDPVTGRIRLWPEQSAATQFDAGGS